MPHADLDGLKLYFARPARGRPERRPRRRLLDSRARRRRGVVLRRGRDREARARRPQPRRDDRRRARRTDRSLPGGLVLVDPGPIDYLPETVEFFTGFAEQLEGPGGEDVRREHVHDMGSVDDDLARWIVDHMCIPEQPIAAAVIRGVSEWRGREPFARCDVPVLLIRREIGADSDVLRLQAIKPDLQVAITVGAGHFHQLEVPEQVNAMIERFLAVSL